MSQEDELLSIAARLTLLSDKLFDMGKVASSERLGRAAQLLKRAASSGRERPMLRVANMLQVQSLQIQGEKPNKLFEVRNETDSLLGVGYRADGNCIEIISPKPAKVRHDHNDDASMLKVLFKP